MSRRNILAVISTALIAVLSLAQAQEPRYGGTLIFGAHQRMGDMHPWTGVGATKYTYIGSVYESLLDYGFPDGEIIPRLAASWKVSDDGLVYDFVLRNDVTFHDGTPFSAEDVKFTLDQIRAPDSVATLAGALRMITDVTVVDPYHVTVTLREPSAPLLAALATPATAIVSKAWVEAGHDLRTEMNGTGPFVFESHQPGVQATYIRNDNYWREGLPYLDGITVLPYQEQSARMDALKGRAVDFISYVAWQDMDYFRKNSDFTIQEGYNVFNTVRLNVSSPPFDDVRVRQAFNYAIDREEIVDLAWNGQALIQRAGLIYPGTFYYNEDLERWSFDPEKATELLREAGYSTPSDLRFTLHTSTEEIHFDTAVIIQAQLARLGIKVDVIPVDNVAYINLRSSGGYQALQDGQGFFTFDPGAYADWFACDASSAKAVGFCDEELESLLDQANRESDPGVRKELFHAFEERLLDLAPWVFNYWRPQAEAMATYVKGYQRYEPGPIGLLSLAHFENVWLDK